MSESLKEKLVKYQDTIIAILGILGIIAIAIIVYFGRKKGGEHSGEESQKVVQIEGKTGIQESPHSEAERQEDSKKTESTTGSKEISSVSQRDSGQTNGKESTSSSPQPIQTTQETQTEAAKEVEKK